MSSIQRTLPSLTITQEKPFRHHDIKLATVQHRAIREPCMEQERALRCHNMTLQVQVRISTKVQEVKTACTVAQGVKRRIEKTEEKTCSVFYQLLPLIGEGTAANVYKAAEYETSNQRETGRFVAIKINNTEHYLSAIVETSAYKRCVGIPQIVELIESRIWNASLTQYALVFPLLESLFKTYLHKTNPRDACPKMPYAEFKSIAHQLLAGVANLERVAVIHRDIKPENILIKRHPKTNAPEIQICDLGTACGEGIPDFFPNTNIHLGTITYRAPEYDFLPTHTQSVDMWSVGCTLFELFTGYRLFVLSGDTDADKSDHLRLIIKECGYPPAHWLSHRSYVSQQLSRSNAQGKKRLRYSFNNQRSWWPPHSWQDRIRIASGAHRKISIKETECLINLLASMLKYTDRIAPQKALQHRYFSSN